MQDLPKRKLPFVTSDLRNSFHHNISFIWTASFSSWWVACALHSDQLNRVIFLVMGFLHMGHTSSVVAHSTHVPWPHRNAILRGFSRQMAHMLASSISRTWAWSDRKEWSVSKYFSSFSLNSAGLAVAFFPTDEKKGENFKNRRKNYLSWVFTRPVLHSVTLL